MELGDLITLFIHAKDRVSLYWGLYITGITTITGWLLASKDILSWKLKLLISVGFTIFMILNWDALTRSYEFLNVIGGELGNQINRELYEKLKLNLQFPHAKSLVLIVHLILDSLLVIAIWLKPPSSPEKIVKSYFLDFRGKV